MSRICTSEFCSNPDPHIHLLSGGPPDYQSHRTADGLACRCAGGERNFHGHWPRECGEHRTVGEQRAWCYDCTEWCYPRIDAACKGCEIVHLRIEVVP